MTVPPTPEPAGPLPAQYPPPPGYQQPYPAYPQTYPTPDGSQWGGPEQPPPPAPRELRRVVALLVANLTLSVVLTVVTVLARHSIVNYQLDHRHITDPARRAALRDGYVGAVIGRVIGNIVVSVVYAFLVRALLRGRRWAYRRVILIGCAGIVGLALIQFTPYPVWMRVEAVVQALVLAALLYCVLRPEVRAYFAPHLPGRKTRRFKG